MIPMKAGAFSPGHITGFFVIEDTDEAVEKKGSLGAGVSISLGVRTEVSVSRAGKNEKPEAAIFINGKGVKDADVSKRVIEIFTSGLGNPPDYRMTIDHRISVPMGAGFGSSGAGALSLAIALNAVYSAGMTPIEAARIAHQAEVEMKTGLGTVIGEMFGGIEIRIKAGAPGTGEIQHIDFDNTLKLAAIIFGPLSTKGFLSDPLMRGKINKSGRSFIRQLQDNPSIPDFLAYSREFAEQTGVMDSRIAEILGNADDEKIMMSMPMFGNGVFTIAAESDLEKALHIFRKYGDDGDIIVSDIDRKGAHLIYAD